MKKDEIIKGIKNSLMKTHRSNFALLNVTVQAPTIEEAAGIWLEAADNNISDAMALIEGHKEMTQMYFDQIVGVLKSRIN